MTDASDLLRRSKRIAIVGASRTPGKDAHDVPARLVRLGYDIVPVNPSASELYGRACYPTLADVPGEIDLVDVFRPSEDAPDVARQAAAVGAKALWLQLGIESEEARRIAEDAGMAYVEDECIWVVARALPARN